MAKKLLLPLYLILLEFSAASCGQFETSQYNAGSRKPADVADATKASEDAESNTEPNTENPPPSGNGTAVEVPPKSPGNSPLPPPTQPEQPKKEPTTTPKGDDLPVPDLAFNTGIPACIKQQLTSTAATIFSPRKLTKTLKDFSSVELADQKEFELLSDLILREVVNTEGLVNYGKLRGELAPQWTSITNAIRSTKGIVKVPPASVSFDEKAAFWTNIYNLTMIDIIVTHPNASNVAIDLTFGAFDEVYLLAGYKLSLNGIEKGILRLGGDNQRVPSELKVDHIDPRLHFTLVCGALSCPKLRNFLYRGSAMEQIMVENTLMVANSTKFFTMDSGYLLYSGLFKFYRSDFEKLYGNSFAKAPDAMFAECRSDIQDIKNAISNNNLIDNEYDWTINKQE